MLDFKKILVPYDGSSHAKKALNQAISLAQCSDGAELYVATILNSTIPADDDPDQVDMAEVEKLIPENIPHKVLLEMGEPVPMLLYLAGEIGADLIITGSRGCGALKSLFMGSVSSGILKIPIPDSLKICLTFSEIVRYRYFYDAFGPSTL